MTIHWKAVQFNSTLLWCFELGAVTSERVNTTVILALTQSPKKPPSDLFSRLTTDRRNSRSSGNQCLKAPFKNEQTAQDKDVTCLSLLDVTELNQSGVLLVEQNLHTHHVAVNT